MLKSNYNSSKISNLVAARVINNFHLQSFLYSAFSSSKYFIVLSLILLMYFDDPRLENLFTEALTNKFQKM